MSEYSIYSSFDIQQHKEKYVNYLEVVISPDGVVEYAVPSHSEILIRHCCEMKGISREQLYAIVPREYYFDMMTWLCMQSGYIAVWNDSLTCYGGLTKKQESKLKSLKLAGIYRGRIPKNDIF